MEMSVQANQSELTLGPVLFNWQPERWRDFYFRIADEAPVTDTVPAVESARVWVATLLQFWS